MERDSVSLKTNQPVLYGKGDAIHNWKADHAIANITNMRVKSGPGVRPPRSFSATNCDTSTSGTRASLNWFDIIFYFEKNITNKDSIHKGCCPI